MGCHFLFQGIFPTQGSNLGLPPGTQPGSPTLQADALTSEPPETDEVVSDRKPVEYFLSSKQGLDNGTVNADIVVSGLMLCCEITGSFT